MGERGNFLWLAQKHTGDTSCILSTVSESRHTLCRYPLNTSDEALKLPYEQYPVTICGQTIILTNGELAAALLSLPEKKREIIYLYFFWNYTQQEIGDLYGQCKSTTWHYIRSALKMLQEEMEVLLHGEY